MAAINTQEVSNVSEVAGLIENCYDVCKVRLSGCVDAKHLVGRENVTLNDGDFISFPYYGLVSTDGRIIPVDHSVSAKHVHHTKADFRSALEAGLAAIGGNGKISAHWNNNGYFGSFENRDDSRYNISGNPRDYIRHKFIVHMPHDGSVRLGLAVDAAICSNLMMFKTIKSSSFNVRHTLSFKDRFDYIVDSFHRLEETQADIAAKIETLNAKSVKIDDFVQKFILAGKDSMSKQLETRIEKILSRVYRESVTALGNADRTTATAWRLWSGLQGYLQHDATRKSEENEDKVFRAVGLFDEQELVDAEKFLLAC